jgi:TolA-binding protein
MRNNVLVYFVLLLIGGWSWLYFKFYGHFNDPSHYLKKIETLKADVIQRDFQNQLIYAQAEAFKLEVSSLLPEVLKEKPNNEKNYPLRSLASLVNVHNKDQLMDSKMRREFIAAKDIFNKKDFKVASQALKSFISQNPFSIKISEAYFLLNECYFQLSDFENSLLIVEKMIELFPGDELTGYAMIRMGKIYEIQDRPEEAVDIYQTVLQSFPDRGLATQAQLSLSSVEL